MLGVKGAKRSGRAAAARQKISGEISSLRWDRMSVKPWTTRLAKAGREASRLAQCATDSQIQRSRGNFR